MKPRLRHLPWLVIAALLITGLFLGFGPTGTYDVAGDSINCGSAFLPSHTAQCVSGETEFRPVAIVALVAAAIGAIALLTMGRRVGDQT